MTKLFWKCIFTAMLACMPLMPAAAADTAITGGVSTTRQGIRNENLRYHHQLNRSAEKREIYQKDRTAATHQRENQLDSPDQRIRMERRNENDYFGPSGLHDTVLKDGGVPGSGSGRR